MPKVSICIPAYNQTEFLKKNLQSVLEQTYTDYEVIISDDSTNNEVEQLVKTVFATSQIKYIYHKNQKALGSPANWNMAVSLASGEYIKIMHHDDWFKHTGALSSFVLALDQNPKADFVFSDTEILNIGTGKISYNKPDATFLQKLESDPLVLFNENRAGAPTATMYRNSIGLRFDEKIKYVVDVDFYIRVLKKNPSFVYIGEPLIVNTSNHPGQVTSVSMNKAVQVGEYTYLYNKLFKGAFPSKKYRTFFRNLFVRYQLNSLDEIEEMGYEKPRPTWIFRYLVILAKIKRNG